MKRLLAACLLASILATTPAFADSLGSAVGGQAANQSSLSGGLCLTSPVSLSNGQQRSLLVDCTTGALIVEGAGSTGVPILTSPAALTAVAGTQRSLTISSATPLTVPATATTALIQAQGTNNSSGVCLYWQDDGTAPTTSAGQQMAAGAGMFYKVSTLPINLIAATGASCTATISYYK